MTERPDTQHPSDEQVAACLDGRLTTNERAQVLTHFAACAECRREMTVAHKVLGPWRDVRRAPIIGLVTVLAAVLAFVVVRPIAHDPAPSAAAVRMARISARETALTARRREAGSGRSQQTTPRYTK